MYFHFIVLFLIFFLPIFNSCSKQPPPDVNDPGQLLYLGFGNKDVNCARCHGEQGAGGWQAPDIRGASEKYEAVRIREIILLGKGEGDDAMPGLRGSISENEITAILAFLRTLSSDNN